MKTLKITIKVLAGILLVFILYTSIYNIIYALPSKIIEINELDYSKNSNEFYIDEDDYQNKRNDLVSYIKNYEHEDYLSIGDIELCYSSYILDDSKASIVISHGYTENKDKYEEMIYYYLKSKYSVFIIDHRGHGKSTREVEDNSLVYIDSMDTYASDLNTFITTVVSPLTLDKKVILFGHSMGGGISTLLAQDYPDSIDLLILSAPMIKANLGLDEAIAYPIIKMMEKINGKSYVIGNSGYDSNYEFSLASASTSSEARAYYNFLSYSLEHNQLWGASYSWANAVIEGTHKIQKKKNIEKIKVPVLLFQAGNDNLVCSEGQNQLINYTPNITAYKASDSKHELWNEKNNILVPYYNTIFEYIDNNINLQKKALNL